MMIGPRRTGSMFIQLDREIRNDSNINILFIENRKDGTDRKDRMERIGRIG